MNELIWRDIPGYEGYYQCSNYGEIKSLKRIVHNQFGEYVRNERILKPKISKKCGYYIVDLCVNRKITSFYIHKIVAQCFLININNYEVINHVDKNKLNNNIENLERCNYRYNSNYSIDKTKTSSKYSGVSWNKRYKKWQSQIYHNGKSVFLGLFSDEYEAHQEYLKYIEKLTSLTHEKAW